MLLNHNPAHILGKWENIRVEGTQLLADAVFDEKDPEAVKMYEKVEQGMLNCVSIGFQILEAVLGVEGFENNPVVIKCTLKEASLTPVPANEGALRLYDKDGALLSDEQLLTLLSINQNQMKKIQFLIAALSLHATATEDEIIQSATALSKKVNDLEADKTALTNKLTAAELKVTTEKNAKAVELVADGIKSGKIKADQKEQYEKLAKSDYDLAKSVIDGLSGHKSLSSVLEGNKGASNKYEGWGLKRLHKEAHEELARIKSEEPERFKELLKENK